MQLYAATDESDTGNIKIGTEATFQVDAFPTEVFRGRVSAIRLNATTVQNVVTYNTVIDFENPEGKPIVVPFEALVVAVFFSSCWRLFRLLPRSQSGQPRPD